MWTNRRSCHISHTHSSTPFRYLLWSKLSHLVKDPYLSRKLEHKAVKTIWHNDALSHLGGWWQEAYIITAHEISHDALSVSCITFFIYKILIWARCGAGCVTLFVKGHNTTSHVGSCCLPAGGHLHIFLLFPSLLFQNYEEVLLFSIFREALAWVLPCAYRNFPVSL